jgi:hypothetical protein
MKYMIVETRHSDDLESQVNDMIKSGWIPLGGVCVRDVEATWGNCTNPPCEYHQAMIFEE